MSTNIISLNAARKPQQERGRDRFERILAESERMLLENGPAGFSIPDLANRLGYTRTSVYHFFPTSAAILNELTERYLLRLEEHAHEAGKSFEHLPWPEVLHAISGAVTAFHNANPVGRMLILGAPVSEVSHRALELTIEHLGRQIVRLMRSIGVELPREKPNAPALTVELGTACLRLSFHLHGEVTPEYQRASAQAMIAYLENFVSPH